MKKTDKAGKLNSSRNAAKPANHSQTLTLDHESDDRFALILSSLETDLQPRNSTERALVLRIAHAEWRTLRLWSQEKALFDRAAEEVRRASSEPSLRTADCAGMAFRKLAGEGPLLALLDRHENRYERIYHRAFRQLSRLREQPLRLERLRLLVEIANKTLFKNDGTNPTTSTKQTTAEKTNPGLLNGWRPSAELEARIAASRKNHAPSDASDDASDDPGD